MQWKIHDFPDRQRDAPITGMGSQPHILAIFPENCMKLKKMDQERSGRTSVAYHEIENGIFQDFSVW